MEFDYSRLRGRIREKYRTEANFAAAMGIGRVSMSQKLNNETDFTQRQMLKAVKLLDIESREIPDYFYSVKVQKDEHAIATL